MLDVVSITAYDRDMLLNIGSSIAQRKLDFEFLNAGGLFTDTASEPWKLKVKSLSDESRVRYYSNSLLDVAFPLYEVNQWYSKCAPNTTLVVLRHPLLVRRGLTKLNKNLC